MKTKLMQLADNYATAVTERTIVGRVRSRAALLAEVERVSKDAERYQWLRDQDDTSPLFCMYGSNGPWGECGHSDIYGELLDTSIDEEMKGKS